MAKKNIYNLLVSLLIPMLILSAFAMIGGASPVYDLATTSTSTTINVSWNGDAVENYTLALENNVIFYTASPPGIDGVLSEEYTDAAHLYPVLTPDPLYSGQFDTFYLLHDDSALYVMAQVDAASSNFTADVSRIYIDPNHNGVDSQDSYYEISGTGELSRYTYASDWVLTPGSGATCQIDELSNTARTVELSIPLTEIETLDNITRFRIERLHETIITATAWINASYEPIGAYGMTTLAVIPANQTLYSVSGLASDSWYRVWVYPDGNLTEIRGVSAYTINTENEDVNQLNALSEGDAPAVETPASVEKNTTSLWLLYVLIALMIVFFLAAIAVFILSSGEPNIISIFSNLVSAVLAFRISNLFIDGTLQNVVTATVNGTAASSTEIVRDPSASLLFQFLGVGFGIILLLQIYYFLANKKIMNDLEEVI